MTGTTENLAAVLNFIKEGALKSRVETRSFEEIGQGFDRMKSGDYQGRLVAMFDHSDS